jgi:tRNA (guanine-N7-)-methyltransferase
MTVQSKSSLTELKPEFRDKSIRSFVVRGGRLTHGQRRAFEDAWPRYGLKLADGALDVDATFTGSAELVVEVGFGMGDSLLEMAAAAPAQSFIGIEVHPPGVGRLINEAQLRDLDNLKVYMADANDVLAECFADGSISRFQLYFPDPWHKKKHNKRRIVQPEFLRLITAKLKPGGTLHMATDWQPYAEQMLELLSAAEGLVNTATGDNGAETGYCPRPDFRPETKFERRGERLGHGVWDLLFNKV